jgi:hypothetical protein
MPKRRDQSGGGPTPSRPHIPGYGVPKSRKGLLAWSHVSERMTQARNYWIGTTDADGAPHAVPVWGVWLDDTLYFSGGQTHWSRNLAANPAAVVHLESGDDVVIIKGTVERVTDRAVVKRAGRAGAVKYEGAKDTGDDASADSEDDTGDTSSGEGIFALRPRVAYAWSQGLASATRWRFGDE